RFSRDWSSDVCSSDLEFTERLAVHLGSFEHFQPEFAYDLIVSNPPFYTNSLHNPDKRRRLAKHTDISFFEKLFSFVSQYLTDDRSEERRVGKDVRSCC